MFNKQELKKRYAERLKELKQLRREGHGPDFGWDVYAFQHGPKAELLARVNAWVNWIDPGAPVNWRGM